MKKESKKEVQEKQIIIEELKNQLTKEELISCKGGEDGRAELDHIGQYNFTVE